MTKRYFPRISDAIAVELLKELTPLPTEALVERAAVEHRAMSFYPTATSRATPEFLQDLQMDIREVARSNGYPTPAGRRGSALRNFDHALSVTLFERMDIVVADAASDEVWSFLSLVLAPDVALWRFPNRQSREDYERLLGRPRNVFRRLWWRSYALGPDTGSRLFEDEAVAILERPNIGGDPAVARAIATTHLKRMEASDSPGRTEVLRDAMKRIRRLAAIVALGALLPEELDELLDEVFTAAIDAVAGT